MDSKSSCVAAYTEAGFALFACGASPTRKAPMRRDWQSTPHRPDLTAAHLPDEYGVVLTDEDVVLDVDPRRFTNDVDQLKALWAMLKLESPETLVVRSGGGGWHIYYKKPAEEKVKAVVPGHAALELKTAGKYVIGAGANVKGNEYKVVRGDVRSIQRIPAALLDFVRAEAVTDQEFDIESDDDNTKLRYTKYLSQLAPPAVSGAGGNNTTYRVACEGRDYGLTEAAVFTLMLDYYNPRCQPEWTPDELRQRVRNAFAYAKGAAGKEHPLVDFEGVDVAPEMKAPKHKVSWELDPKGGYKCTLNNLVNFFYLPDDHPELSGLLRFNRFARSVEFTRRAPWHEADKLTWDDYDSIMLRHHLGAKASASNSNMIYDAVRAVAWHYQYHPIESYLSGLKWDNVPRLDKLLVTYAGADDNQYTRAVGRCTLLAAVARVFNPGCQHDSMLVLEGPQGTGKSTFVRILGGAWYADIIMDPHSKDTVSAMTGSWIIECSEMEVTKRTEVAALKSFLTKVIDKVRLPYERCSTEIPRQQVFIGTVNPDGSGYLKDTTGNRRFWPVLTRRIDTIGLKRDRDQIFAEAVARYRLGEPHHLTSDYVIELAKQEQSRRAQADPWDEVIGDWLGRVGPRPELTTEMVAYEALMLPVSKLDKYSHNRISNAMRALGYESERRYSPTFKCTLRIWVRDELAGL